jgi:hypothetical protein
MMLTGQQADRACQVIFDLVEWADMNGRAALVEQAG